MTSKKNNKLVWIFAALTLLAVTFTFALPLTAMSAEKKTPKWVWSKERPKPYWFDWSDKFFKGKPTRGGILRVASLRYVGVMNPNHWPVNDWSAIINFYEGRMAFDGTYRQRRPWLVETFKFVSPTVVEETYKQGVRYTDGSEMTAESILYLFNWIADKRNGAWSRGTTRIYEKVEIVDKYTLRYTTKKPWGKYPAGWFAFIISAEALKGDVLLREIKGAKKKAGKLKKKLAKLTKKSKGTEKDNKKINKAAKAVEKLNAKIAEWKKKAAGHINTDLKPVGTGPFMLEKASSGNFLKLKRNPDWWFGQSIGKPEMPYYDGILITIIPDPSIRLANLRAGRIDQMGVDKAQYYMIRNNPNMNVHAYVDNHARVMIMNHQSKALSDIRVRKAISHAIDRNALIAGTEFSLARSAGAIYPEDHWAHNPNLKPVKYDPELSKKLLAQAGYGKGLTIKGYTGTSTADVTRAEAVKSMLAMVGINWKVDILSPAAIDDRMKNLEYDLSFGFFAYIQDPSSVVENFYRSTGRFNAGRFKDPEIDKLIDAAREKIAESDRQVLYYQLEQKLYDNYTDVWLWYEMSAVARQKRIQGYNPKWYEEGRTHYFYSHPMWFKDGKRE